MIGRKLRRLRRTFYTVPWCVPRWGLAELGATLWCVLTGRVRNGGSIERFVEAVRRYLGVQYALPVNRGRTAIEVALRALGVGEGDDVVVPAYVCESVVEAIDGAGARPVFADVGPDLHTGVEEIRAALTPATRCVIAVHLFGGTAPVDEIERMLEGSGIALIDDAAQGLGASRSGRRIGTFGACGIVSCGPGKPLSGAAGGCLVTNDRDLYARAAAVRLNRESTEAILFRTLGWWVWRRFRRWTLPLRLVLDHLAGEGREGPHVNAPLANLDAAIALHQLETLEARTSERRANARRLLNEMPALREGVIGSPEQELAIKLIVVLPDSGPTMAEAIEMLGDLGLECQRGYTPIRRDASGDSRALPITTDLWPRVLCVPVDLPWHARKREPMTGWPMLAAVPAGADKAAHAIP
jgi:dTDP-4-amino-4,6-dideoxygalactose transaminase